MNLFLAPNRNNAHQRNDFCRLSEDSWKKKEGSGMVVMEINQPTGFKASNVDDLKNDVIKRVENKDDKVVLYLDEVIDARVNDSCLYYVLILNSGMNGSFGPFVTMKWSDSLLVHVSVLRQ